MMSSIVHREWRYLLAAVMFYTRIPVPANTEHSVDILNRSRRYFPAIGLLVGGVAAITFCLSHIAFAQPTAIVLSMISTILLTGAFHEDGLADTCDGLGGGWHRDQVLSIMKDSRIGTYGCVALILCLLLKFTALLEAQDRTSTTVFMLVLIAGHTLSRQLASSVIEYAAYVQDSDQSKVKPITDRRLSLPERCVSYGICLLPVLGLSIYSGLATLVATIASILSIWAFMRYCNQRLGGYTGDILGACQQISEVSFYLAFIAGLA